MNLALRRGTGISTYSRVLSIALGDLGASVDVLYGLSISGSLTSFLKEVSFFDRLGGDPPTTAKWKNALREESELLLSPLGYTAFPILATGKVVPDTFRTRLPHYERLLNIHDLFLKARRHYKRYRRFLEVRIPDPPAVMHWTYPLPIRLKDSKNIYTIHDLVPLRLPYTTLDNKRYFYRLVRDCLIHGDQICTVSERSKADIQDIFHDYPPKRLVNTYQTVSIPKEFLAKNDDEIATEISSAFNLKHRDYFLFFGAIEPKKNVGRVIEAFLYAKTKSPLVLVGSKAWKSDQELELLNNDEQHKALSRTQRRVRRIEYTSFSLLVSLIRGAKAVIWPSLYEGFGLPVLEAMMLGTPVITSTGGSLPEIAGEAALIVDPYETAQIVAAVQRLDNDADLRKVLVQRGYDQAAKFSMERYRERLHTMYSELLST